MPSNAAVSLARRKKQRFLRDTVTITTPGSTITYGPYGAPTVTGDVTITTKAWMQQIGPFDPFDQAVAAAGGDWKVGVPFDVTLSVGQHLVWAGQTYQVVYAPQTSAESVVGRGGVKRITPHSGSSA